MDLDAFTDPAIDEVARLLYESLRARYGEAIVTSVLKRPVSSLVELSRHKMPFLVVTRQSDRADADDDVSDNEVVTLNVEYYAGGTPFDRIPGRWARLRAVWAHCLSRLHAGFDPLIPNARVNVAATGEDERIVSMLAAAGWRSPMRPVANVRYLFAPLEGDPVPCFQAVVTMRTDAEFDWTFGGTYVHPTLEGVDSDVDVVDPEDDDPDHTEDGFTSSITFA